MKPARRLREDHEGQGGMDSVGARVYLMGVPDDHLSIISFWGKRIIHVLKTWDSKDASQEHSTPVHDLW